MSPPCPSCPQLSSSLHPPSISFSPQALLVFIAGLSVFLTSRFIPIGLHILKVRNPLSCWQDGIPKTILLLPGAIVLLLCCCQAVDPASGLQWIPKSHLIQSKVSPLASRPPPSLTFRPTWSLHIVFPQPEGTALSCGLSLWDSSLGLTLSFLQVSVRCPSCASQHSVLPM